MPVDEFEIWRNNLAKPSKPKELSKATGKKPQPQVTTFSLTVGKLRAISAAINFPRARTRRFWAFTSSRGLKNLKAIQDHAVRWNATYRMLERAVYLKEAIQSFVRSEGELAEHELSDQEWVFAEFLMHFLEPFNRTTNLLQGAKRPTLQQVFITYERLFNQLDNVKAIFEKLDKVPEWFEEVKYGITEMWNLLKKYYTAAEAPTPYVDANVLHPAKKLSLFRKKDSAFAADAEESYRASAKARWLTEYEQPLHNIPAKRSYPTESDSDDDSDSYDDVETSNDFDQYLGRRRDKSIQDPVMWWKNSQTSFPTLATWARDIFAVPATGCGVEREFSFAGALVTKQRNQLHGQTISDLMQYKRWVAKHSDVGEDTEVEEMDQPLASSERPGGRGQIDDLWDGVTDFDERNDELEEWLADWVRKRDIIVQAQTLFV